MVAGKPTVVLIIDSDNVRRGMLACTLPTSRYVLEFAKTAQAGLDLLAKAHPVAVIIGLDDSTADLCQRIRQLPAGRETVLLLMDERFINGSHEEATNAGADAALPFPFELERLERALARTTSDHRRQRPTGAVSTGSSPTAKEPTLSFAAPDETPPPDLSDVAEIDPWELFSARVDSFHSRLQELDYYQMLEVERRSSPAHIKDAYFARSVEFHPDRFMRLHDEDLKDRVYEVYKRMSEAFRVLSQPEARARYDAELDASPDLRSLRLSERERERDKAPPSANTTTTAAGRRYLQLANLAELEGNLKSARMYLTLAVQVEPDNGALREELESVTTRLSLGVA